MKYARMAIEVESPEHFGYGRTKNDLMETSVRDRSHRDLCAEFNELLLSCGDHPGGARLRELIACQSGLCQGSFNIEKDAEKGGLPEWLCLCAAP